MQKEKIVTGEMDQLVPKTKFNWQRSFLKEI